MVPNNNDILIKAQNLKVEAMKVIGNPEASAEELVTAEKQLNDAQSLVDRAKKLNELNSKVANMGNIAFDEKIHGVNKQEVKETFGNNFGQFLTSVKAASSGQRQDSRLKYFDSELESKDLASNAGATGGYLVPTEFMPTLMQEVEEASIVRSRAMVIPMTRRTIEVPALKQDGTTTGQPNWFGGMMAFWEAEAAQLQETEPAFRNVSLTAHELTAVTHVSNNLLADSAVSLAALLTGPRGFSGVVSWKEDYAFLQGSGVGEPLGVLNSPATLGVSRATANKISYDDLVEMMVKFMPGSQGVWVASISAKAQLLKMAGPSNGTDYLGTYLWGNAASGVPAQLLGYPIIFTEKMPLLGQRGDIGLFDFSHYYIGDRQATTIDSTDQTRWLRNQTSWKVVHRVDGQPWLNAPFTLVDGTTKISPFVVLNQ